jgi:serine protease Do
VRALGRFGSTALMLTDIQSGGPAESAGLLSGDLMLEFDGHVLFTVDELHRLLTFERAGRDLSVKILRRGKVLERSIRPVAD